MAIRFLDEEPKKSTVRFLEDKQKKPGVRFLEDEEEPSIGKKVAGLGAEVVVGEGAKLA